MSLPRSKVRASPAPPPDPSGPSTPAFGRRNRDPSLNRGQGTLTRERSPTPNSRRGGAEGGGAGGAGAKGEGDETFWNKVCVQFGESL